jgi:hypothetical protein
VLTPQASRTARAVQEFQAVLPGVRFEVPQQAGISLSLHPDAALLVLTGMQAAPAVRIDLCSQLRAADDLRLLPLRLGYRFDDVQRLVAQNQSAALPQALRNVLLVSEQGVAAGMPLVQISGRAGADFNEPAATLQLNWQAQRTDVRWLSDASFGQIEQGRTASVSLRQQGWLMWGNEAALHIERRSNVTCPQAGELTVQCRTASTGARAAEDGAAQTALVQAFLARGRPVSSALQAGVYQVPATWPPRWKMPACSRPCRRRAAAPECAGQHRTGTAGLAAVAGTRARPAGGWRASLADGGARRRQPQTAQAPVLSGRWRVCASAGGTVQ